MGGARHLRHQYMTFQLWLDRWIPAHRSIVVSSSQGDHAALRGWDRCREETVWKPMSFLGVSDFYRRSKAGWGRSLEWRLRNSKLPASK